MKKQLLTLSIMMMSIGLFSQASTVWKPHNSNIDTLEGIRWLSVVDTNTVWGVGFNGTYATATSTKFTRTQDGNTFISGDFLPDTIYYSSSNISAVNDSVAYIPCYSKDATRAGIVLKTMNRGVTWTNCVDTTTMFVGANNFPDWAHFYTNNHGIVLGDPNGTPSVFEIYHTYNGGASWTRVPATSITPSVTPTGEYGITDAFTWYGNKHLWFGTNHGGTNAVPHVYRSNDTGHTWLSATVPGMLGGVEGLAFRDSLNGLVWGFPSATATSALMVKRTHDGGITWTTVIQHDKVGGSDISVVPGRKAFMSVGIDSTSTMMGGIVGNGIMTSVTYDDGLTWTILEGAPGGAGANVFRMLQLTVLDSSHAWAGCFADTSNKPLGNNGMDSWMGPVIALGCPVVVTGATTLCSGNTTTLTVNGANTYTWMPSGANTNTVSVSPTSTAVYTVTGAAGTCSNTTVYTLTVTPTPTISATSSVASDTIYMAPCAFQNTTTLTATGATTYSWSPSAGLSGTAGPTVHATPTVTTTYTITGHTGACTSTHTMTIDVEICNGINQFSVNGTAASVYPNPSNGLITVSLTNIKSGTAIRILDMLGNEVYKTSVNSNSINQNLNIDLSTLTKGVYFFGLSNGNQSRVQKLIIQ